MSIGPIETYLLFREASHSLNLDKFAKVVCNVVFGSHSLSKGIRLEGDTCLMSMKRKFDGKSHMPFKNVFTINMPIKNKPLAHVCIHTPCPCHSMYLM